MGTRKISSSSLTFCDGRAAHPQRSRRFTTARSLLRFLRQEDRFLITSAYGPAQKRERAFAAELLAPAAGLREMLGEDAKSVGDVDVARIADQFGVQELVVIHQIENNLRIPVRSELT
jgi:Zn-dependent peptidase ImmA (M78 family)